MFKALKGRRLTAYKSAFGKVLQTSVNNFHPDIIHTNHLFLLSALVRKLFPDLPIVTTCHGTDLRQYVNCPHLRHFVKRYCQQLDRVIALTNDQKTEIVHTYEIPPEKIIVAGGGYDETVFNRARLSELMKQAHIQVLPSFFEGLP